MIQMNPPTSRGIGLHPYAARMHLPSAAVVAPRRIFKVRL
jgi:hypothetical protein